MKSFKKLTESENNTLLKFPVFISLLAANSDSELDETEKNQPLNFPYKNILQRSAAC